MEGKEGHNINAQLVCDDCCYEDNLEILDAEDIQEEILLGKILHYGEIEFVPFDTNDEEYIFN
jgi:hypothetical protein